ncbi:MAG TPA: hypothetical protein VFX61_21020, partial [Micromonosporaceae bacterium]|nr:hypothetical protein [Micromonosporaceae bacterium]
MADDPDVTLTVALAEYEHLREARRANTDSSAARFNFFLVVATGAAAVTGGLITSSGTGPANLVAAASIGGLVLLLGLTVFVRQVEFVNRAKLYGVAINSVRTYLSRRTPELAPYLLMPTLDTPGVYQARPPGSSWLRDSIGLAGTIGLINSTLLAAGTGFATGALGVPVWGVVLATVAVFTVSMIGHIAYVRHRTVTAYSRIQAAVEERYAAGDQEVGNEANSPAPPPQP